MKEEVGRMKGAEVRNRAWVLLGALRAAKFGRGGVLRGGDDSRRHLPIKTRQAGFAQGLQWVRGNGLDLGLAGNGGNGANFGFLGNADGHKGVLLPTELRTKELAMLPVWVRERSFFMAGVTQGEVLQEFSDRVLRMARGDVSLGEARAELRDELDRLGYAPEAGQEGTIKDLRSMRRKNVALETNLLQVQGYARWARQQQALGGFPAQRFVRVRMSRVPRVDWPERFAAAVAATTPVGADVGTMTALVNHPCWEALSVFGTPYAPFDFGSGMGLEPVPRAEAEALGIVPEDENPMMQPQDRGLNEALEATPAVAEDGFRKVVAEVLQGLARWEGKTLVFTDPNGTRGYTAEALAGVWSEPLPQAFADLPGGGQMQREAFVEWVRDSSKFEEKGYTDKWADLLRVHRRIEPAEHVPVLYRGMSMSNERLNVFLDNLKNNGGYAVRAAFPVESWTIKKEMAQIYAESGGGGWSVVVEAPAEIGMSFKEISPLVRKFAGRIGKQSSPPVQTEGEWWLGKGRPVSYKVFKDSATRTVRVVLGRAKP